jgi:tripartite-type tricarboxylate transporter receptor subunit TctC
VFHSLIGIKPTVVSYRGTPQATQDVLAGNVDFLCNQIVNIVDEVAPPQQRSPAAFEEFMRKEVDLWARVLGSMKPANSP